MKQLDHDLFSNQHFLFVFDLDGTLLNDEKKIVPSTKEILKELMALGNQVTLASGRPPRAVLPYYHELGLTAPFVSYNGALVRDDNPTHKPLVELGISPETIRAFLSHFGEDAFVNVMAENDDKLYYLKPNKLFDFFFHPEGMDLHTGSIVDSLDCNIMTMVVQGKDTSRNPLWQSYLESLDKDLSLRFWYDAPTFGEAYHHSVNKATSIEKVAQSFGLDRAHIVAFGDAPNDIEMIRSAGISFGMLNGSDLLKNAASHITPEDNNHDGIQQAILSLFGKDDNR